MTAACCRSCRCCSRSCSTPTPTCPATWSRRRARRTASSRACSAPSVCALTGPCTATASTPLASSSPPRPPGHRHPTVTVSPRLQALVYDILPSTTAVFSYTIGPRKLSADEHIFVGAQTVAGLLQTTHIKQGVSCIAANKVYTSTNKTTVV